MMLALGVDAGGTASRAVLSTADGGCAGRGVAGPGNPTTSGAAAVSAIGTAIRAALGDHRPESVAAAVVGVAGAGVLADPELAAAFAAQWAELGLTCPVSVVGDAVTAFAAGTPERSGVVLIAGTGAVAARVDDGRIGPTADGLGWLLGDEGSGLWLGLQAVRAAARDWPPAGLPAARAPLVPPAGASGPGLVARVAAHAGVRSCDELVHWAGRQPPAAFAALAPLVCAAAAAGDPLASRLTAEAGARLVATLNELGPPDGPVVLAGGLLSRDTPVRRSVLAAVSGPVTVAREPALGAARLALDRAVPLGRSAAALRHARMIGSPVPGSCT